MVEMVWFLCVGCLVFFQKLNFSFDWGVGSVVLFGWCVVLILEFVWKEKIPSLKLTVRT